MTGRKDKREYSSADYQAIAREHREALETNKRIFLRSGLFVILTALVIILAALGWFVMNNRTEAVSSLISAMSSRYALTTPGDEIGIWERGNTSLVFDTSDKMNISDDSNFKNTGETSKLSPGSFGEIEFVVDPIATDLANIEVTIDMNLQFRNENNITVSETERSKLAEYVKGHILFFTHKDGRYYSDWIGPESGSYKLTIPAAEFKDENGKTTKNVSRKLYWIWPQQFHNYVYAGGGSYYRNLFASESSAGYSDLIKDMNNHKNRYFECNLRDGITIGSDMNGADYDSCTDAFNEADQLIGEKVEFIQIRINTVENGGGA